jgi:hypothetical protein
MATVHRFRWLCGIALAAAFAAGATRLSAADPSVANGGATPAAAASSGTVEIFDAMHNGDLGVQFIPHNSKEASLILTNNTDKPLNVHVPDAFAAIPVLAQNPIGGGGAAGRNTGTGNKNNNQQNQSVGTGGGAGQGQQRQGGFGGAVGNAQAGAAKAPAGNGAAFSIPPERVVKLKLPTVCLEFGKAEPNARVPYTIVPIETFTSNAEVAEVCRLLASGSVDQQVAQAAAWHLANHLSWDKLADMKHFPHTGFARPVFSSDQIRAALALTDKAIKLADARSAAAPGVTPSAAKTPAPSTATPATTSASSPSSKAIGLE